MNITIPKNLTSGKELIIIPKEEYDALITLKDIYEFNATPAQKKTLSNARKNRIKGKVLTLGQFKQKLGLTN